MQREREIKVSEGFFDLTMLLEERAGEPGACGTCLLKQNIVDGDSADEARGVGLDLDGDACAVMTCNIV